MGTSGVMKMNFADESGVVAPLGYWDPAGFSDSGDVEQFNRYRAVEVKLPGALSTSAGINFADVPSGLAALKVVPVAGWAQILLFQSALEILAPQDPEKAPGDVQPESERGASFKRYDDPEVRKDKLTKELNNGRLAMMAIAGTWASDAPTNSQDPIDVLLSKFSG